MYFFANLSLIILFFSAAGVFVQLLPSHNVKGKIELVKQDVNISFEGWYDPKSHRSRVDYFDSATKSYQLPYQDGITRLLKIVPASDGNRNWTACFKVIVEEVTFQPTIPFNIDRRNATNVKVNGISCTLYTQVLNETDVITIKKYWAFKKGLSEIPVQYKFKMYNSDYFILNHYFIRYHDYKEALIPSEVFKVDPKFVDKCDMGDDVFALNPMRNYVDVNDNSQDKVIRLNLDFIDRINNAGLDYKLGINKFIDWTHKRYLTLFHAKPLPSSIHNQREPYPSDNDRVPVNLPEELDLRKLGFVTPVKDELSCGSSSAFGAAGTLEGAYYKKYKTLITLSEQAIVDCGWIGDNKGCFSGSEEDVFFWAKVHGVPAYSDYYRRYSGIENYCVLSNQSFNVTVKEYLFVKPESIDALKQALVEYGPVAASIDASQQTFRLYSSGVYTDPACLSGHNNHAVLVVGYGVQNGTSYWLIKNSWGTNWGEHGYIKISQRNNLCGVLDYPAVAFVN